MRKDSLDKASSRNNRKRVTTVSQTRRLKNKVSGRNWEQKEKEKPWNKDKKPDWRLALYASRKDWIVTE